jgi:chloramphenicol O-acetyltransferase
MEQLALYQYCRHLDIIILKILANNQLDAFFRVFIYFVSLHVSSITVLIIRISNCINTSSGMIN